METKIAKSQTIFRQSKLRQMRDCEGGLANKRFRWWIHSEMGNPQKCPSLQPRIKTLPTLYSWETGDCREFRPTRAEQKGRTRLKMPTQKTHMYDHMIEAHNGSVPPIKLEIVERFTNEPGVRQAAESVLIREQKPPLNGKEEWTNLPRKRRETETVTSNSQREDTWRQNNAVSSI